MCAIKEIREDQLSFYSNQKGFILTLVSWSVVKKKNQTNKTLTNKLDISVGSCWVL